MLIVGGLQTSDFFIDIVRIIPYICMKYLLMKVVLIIGNE